MPQVNSGIVTAIFLLLAIIVGIHLWLLYHALGSRTWPSVTGTIKRSFVAREHNFLGTTLAVPSITYEYEVQGTTYTSQRIGWTRGAGRLSSDACALVRYWRKDTPVQVHYHPDRPEFAVLMPGTRREAVFIIGAPLALAAVLIYGFAT